jgi:hypothetical protein
MWSCRPDRTIGCVFVLLLPILCLGCLCPTLHLRCPEISKFAVTSQNVCAGHPVTLSWEAKGCTTLTATPSADCVGRVASAGSRRCTLRETTTFALVARRGGAPGFSKQEVRVMPTSGTDSVAIAGKTECGGWGVVGVADLPAEEWDQGVEVETVTSDGSREISVIHGGRRAILDATHPTSAVLSGAKLSGRWVLGSPLVSGETCDPRAAASGAGRLPPDILMLTIQSRCRE